MMSHACYLHGASITLFSPSEDVGGSWSRVGKIQPPRDMQSQIDVCSQSACNPIQIKIHTGLAPRILTP